MAVVANQAVAYDKSMLTACRRSANLERMVGYSSIKAKLSLRLSVGRLDANIIVYGPADSLLAAQVPLRRLHGNMAQQKLNLLQLTASRMAEPRARSPEVVRREFGSACFPGEFLHHSQTAFSVSPSPQIVPVLWTRRNSLPLLIPAAEHHSSSSCRTQPGSGIVRIWPDLPIKSTKAQWSSRC